MAEQSLAQPAHPSATTTDKPRRRSCEACGEMAGSISAGTGAPLVRDRETGAYFHVRCHPGTIAAAALLTGLGV